MSLKKISKNQPDTFEFDSKNLSEAEKIISNYPDNKFGEGYPNNLLAVH